MSDQAKELKHIDKSVLSFNANGKEYTVETGMSINRFMKYQELEIEAAYGLSVPDLIKKLSTAITLLNSVKFVDAAVLLSDTANGINKMRSRVHPIFRLCALFINTKDEDKGDITEEAIEAKINDWKAEAISVEFFFACAKSTMLGFTESLLAEMESNLKEASSPAQEQQTNE